MLMNIIKGLNFIKELSYSLVLLIPFVELEMLSVNLS